ncbi:GDSL-motif lipase 3 [Striga asiatica]|uniref:GDSL-motif lipase 3 n=1 Tax=Striga asiatica TaxID=4170 RepID=A0A5A7RFS5_STRAF|nr:GDSL-motif lipase 3 [Striga asiatica]
MVTSFMKGGLVGFGKSSLPTSISKTFDIDGLNEGISCMHKSATWTTRKISGRGFRSGVVRKREGFQVPSSCSLTGEQEIGRSMLVVEEKPLDSDFSPVSDLIDCPEPTLPELVCWVERAGGSFQGIGLRKSISEYLKKQPVLRARPSVEGKHPKTSPLAFPKQARQARSPTVLQQLAIT